MFQPGAFAEDVSGTWHMVANGRGYILRLTQRGEKIYGMSIPENNNHRFDCILEGTIRGDRVLFLCHNREISMILRFRGILVDRKENKIMFGIFNSNTRRALKWHAIKY